MSEEFEIISFNIDELKGLMLHATQSKEKQLYMEVTSKSGVYFTCPCHTKEKKVYSNEVNKNSTQKVRTNFIMKAWNGGEGKAFFHIKGYLDNNGFVHEDNIIVFAVDHCFAGIVPPQSGVQVKKK